MNVLDSRVDNNKSLKIFHRNRYGDLLTTSDCHNAIVPDRADAGAGAGMWYNSLHARNPDIRWFADRVNTSARFSALCSCHLDSAARSNTGNVLPSSSCQQTEPDGVSSAAACNSAVVELAEMFRRTDGGVVVLQEGQHWSSEARLAGQCVLVELPTKSYPAVIYMSNLGLEREMSLSMIWCCFRSRIGCVEAVDGVDAGEYRSSGDLAVSLPILSRLRQRPQSPSKLDGDGLGLPSC